MIKKIILCLPMFGLFPVEVFAEVMIHNGVIYETVTSPHTGRVWLDRNLGASQVCTAFNDSACYGDYYQWGRSADGHQASNSTQTYVHAQSIVNAGSDFIGTRGNYNGDWLKELDNNGVVRESMWSRTDGSSVCPVGFRVPIASEFNNETVNRNLDTTTELYNSFLKLPSNGYRNYYSGGVPQNVGEYAFLWTSSKTSTSAYAIKAFGGYVYPTGSRASGNAVRCIKSDTVTFSPSAKAGSDQTIKMGENITFNASGSSDADGTIVGYQWKEGSNILSNSDSFVTSSLSPGVHTINLIVTDNDGEITTDSLIVTVTAANQLPISNAGADQTVTSGAVVTLDASNSSDSDGTIVNYEWKEGATTLSTSSSFTKSDLSIGSHTITLTVTDNDGGIDTDTVVITVNAVVVANRNPIAKAGIDQSVTKGSTVTFNAYESSDSDGAIASFEWKKGNTILSTNSSFTKSDLSVGRHTIILTVRDNKGGIGTDTIEVTVNAVVVETITQNGVLHNSLDFLHSKRYYQFTLDEKSKITIDASQTTAFNSAGWLIDSNGTKISQLNNWEEGENEQFKVEEILEAGTYFFEIFSEDGGYGDYSFSFEVIRFQDFVAEPWNINIPSTIEITKKQFLAISLDIEPKLSTLDLKTNLTMEASGLPDGFSIETFGYSYDYSIVGRVESSEDFDVTLHFTDSKNNYTKEHKISFKVREFSIEGLKGEGKGSAVVIIKELMDGFIQPLKLAFDVVGINENEIDSISCVFRENPILSVSVFERRPFANGHTRFTCDVGLNQFTRGSFSSEDFMAQLIGIDERERFLTIRVNLKDNTYIEKKVLTPIPVEKIEGFISIKLYKPRDKSINNKSCELPPGDESRDESCDVPPDSNTGQLGVFEKGGHYKPIPLSVGQTHYVDYGDEVYLDRGKWEITVGNHVLHVNFDDIYCSYNFVANYDTITNETLLTHNIPFSAENTDAYLSIFGINLLRLGNATDNGFFKFAMQAHKIWRRATALDEDCGYIDYGQDSEAGVRGTTFSISYKKKERKIEVYEGEVELLDKNIILNTMESYSSLDQNKRDITEINLPFKIKQYLDETSLYQSDIDSPVARLNISTNLAGASYILIGDNVRVGGGTLKTFDNISKGSYTLHFLAVDGYDTPNDIALEFDENNLLKEIDVSYSKLSMTSVINGKTIVEAVNAIPLFTQNNWRVTQGTDASSLVINTKENLYIVKHINMQRVGVDSHPEVGINLDGNVELTTNTGVKIILVGTLQTSQELFSKLLADSQLTFFDDGEGLIHAVPFVNSSGSENHYYSFTPSINSVLTEKAAGLYSEPLPALENNLIYYHVFKDQNDQYRKQYLTPYPSDWNALKQMLLGKFSEVSLGLDNIITVKNATDFYQGIMDYRVDSGKTPESSKLEIKATDDLNGDGLQDFSVIYLNGERQNIILLPVDAAK